MLLAKTRNKSTWAATVAARIRIRICVLRSPGIEGAGLSGSPIASVIQYSSPPALPPSPCLDAPLHDSSSPCRQCRIPPSLLANPISFSELDELGELGELGGLGELSCSSVAEEVVAMECSVEFTGIGESTITVVGLNPASVTTRRTPRLRRTWVVDGRCAVGDVHMGPSSSNSSRVQRSLARHFNDLIRRHCERVPLGWASISGAGGETLWEGQKGTGATRDATVGDDETQPSGQDDRKRKSVLILMSDTGGGHRASAEAIKATFELEYGDQYKVHVVDLWKEHTPWPFNQVPRTYSFMVKHETLWRFAFYSTAPRLVHQSQMAATNLFVAREVAKGLAQYQPDVIVSVHPLMQHIPLRVLRARGLLDKVPFTTVITDLSTCHPTWFHKLVTACFCPTRDVAQRALKAGLRESQLRVHGLPIRPSFSTFTRPKDELRKELAMDEDLPAVLLVGGGEGMGPVEATARALGKSLYDANSGKAIGQMVVVCGRNKRLVKKLEQTQWNIPVKINGFVMNMSEWMAASDCIITKAGPGTIAEAMIRELPMLLFDFIAGQEVGNVSFVVENGAGAFCDEPKAISRIIAGWFGVKVGELRQMAENCKKLAQPDAVFKIVHDLDDMVRNKHKYLDHLNFKYCGLI